MNIDPSSSEQQNASSPDEADQVSESDVFAADATPLCPHCLSELDQRASFCPKCQAPVGAFATYDPLQQIHSTGWLYRKASRGRIPAVAVLAFWWIVGPIVLSGLIGLLWIGQRGELGAARIARWLIFLFTSLLYGVLLFRISRNYLRHRQLQENHCNHCGHDFAEPPCPRCPECGTEFQPDADDCEGDDIESPAAQS